MMTTTGEEPKLTSEELARVQSAIDTGTVWSTVDGGRFAKQLIDAQKCKLAPGVVGMWLLDDDRYEPVYSREEFSRRVGDLIRQFPRTMEALKRAEAEVAFLRRHGPDLTKIRTDELLSSETISPIIPALLSGGLAALLLWLAGATPLLGIAIGVLAYVIHTRRSERRRLKTQALVNELRAKAGLPPEPPEQQA